MCCPQCGKDNIVIATRKRDKVLVCLWCGQGWRSIVPRGYKGDARCSIDFGGVLQRIVVILGKRKVKLAPIQVEREFIPNNN